MFTCQLRRRHRVFLPRLLLLPWMLVTDVRLTTAAMNPVKRFRCWVFITTWMRPTAINKHTAARPTTLASVTEYACLQFLFTPHFVPLLCRVGRKTLTQSISQPASLSTLISLHPPKFRGGNVLTRVCLFVYTRDNSKKLGVDFREIRRLVDHGRFHE